ncbi:MAG: glycosyltransferase family 4 protein [Candidatus Eremiobacteraeota bacterium]|nr:glycosyltransferase family 4 protein [Candidatus Eremiobacteraeota bacterium]
MMRVGLDAQLAVGTATGIGEFVRGLAEALRARSDLEVVSLAAPWLDPWRFDRRVAWDQALLPASALRARCELLHCASGTAPLVGAPYVVTVHDVAWLRVQQHARWYARAYFGRFALARYARARALMVDSRFSRDELLETAHLEPAAVSVVEPGVAAAFAALERAPDERPFVLAVGTVERRKNLEVAIRALRAHPGLRLVSVGPATPYADECRRIAAACGVSGAVEFRGYVTPDELLDLYARCAFAAVPSRYEGFGYGVAQARCAGVPIVAADSSSLPDVAGGAATLVAPDDEAGWSDAFGAVLAARGAAEHRAAEDRPRAIARFDWSTAAAAVVAVYRGALGRPPPG